MPGIAVAPPGMGNAPGTAAVPGGNTTGWSGGSSSSTGTGMGIGIGRGGVNVGADVATGLNAGAWLVGRIRTRSYIDTCGSPLVRAAAT